ncbi:hypothetical protein Afil01_54570 [Actinorhabdospora filicis]|uniref:ASCH domain-containing protein n=1 Tax=Actinorhabdospora filicis TaxID=1785913 RepID=A0A9W6SPL3_9ACTN|nr:ASCH domain-containing protein [Actinorhabdospora filicis]GLZ80650.1 hypothetical protein Afil01_54570 [Actinorhabdospora filicis]
MTADLPLGPPGPMRDRLAAAIVSGAKTAGTLLRAEIEAGTPRPVPGERLFVRDSTGAVLAVAETVSVREAALADVDLAHAVAEGLGHTGLEKWTEDHIAYWRRLPCAPAVIDSATPILMWRYRVHSSG